MNARRIGQGRIGQGMARRGLTMIELLVSMIAGSVVLVAAGSLMVSMVEDQRNSSFWREHYYSRARAGMEVLWTARQVSRHGIRQTPAAVNAAQNPAESGGVGVDLDDGNGPRGVMTYVRDTYGQTNAGALVNDRSMTGIVFRYFTTLYRFECDFTAAAGLGIPALQPYDPKAPIMSGFNAMSSGQLKLFILAPGRLQQCELLGAGLDTFDVSYFADGAAPPGLQYSMQWNLNLAR